VAEWSSITGGTPFRGAIGGTRLSWAGLVLTLSALSLLGCQAPGTGPNVEGVKQFQQGQPQAAVYQFQQALAQNPRNPDAYYNLGAAYHYQAKQSTDRAMLSQAETLYNQCLDISPDHVACHRALAVLLVDTNRPQNAFTLLERWSTVNPRSADARIELARLHEEFGEHDAARRSLSEAIDADPSNSRAWAAMARLRESDGDYAQALQNYRQAYALNAYQPGVADRITQLQQRMAQQVPANGTAPLMVETPRGWTQR
jgi:tetratricopeptide (TPR) repeat protein